MKCEVLGTNDINLFWEIFTSCQSTILHLYSVWLVSYLIAIRRHIPEYRDLH